jgi:hypothetical protein
MIRTRRLVLVTTLICVVAIGTPPGTVADEPHGRLGAGLRAVASGRVPDRSIVSDFGENVREIAVSVELMDEPGAAIRGRLQAAGLELRGSWRRTIEGYVRPRDLERLAAVSGVATVRAIRAPIPEAFIGPAPALHGATTWHTGGFTGKSVKVGILDSGFDGFAARLGSELPAAVQARCFSGLGAASPNLADCAGSTHGTAVAESIVDMAPNAELFVSNAYSPADVAATISWMTSNGVRVINYSRASSALMDGMGDGTSIYSNSGYALVDQAVAGGALFVASAGNEGETSWMGPAADANANGWLDFTPGDEANYLDLSAGDVILTAIRWGSPTSDYDLSIWQGDAKLAESADFQSDTRDPLELIYFTGWRTP